MSVIQFDDSIANDIINDDVIQPFQLEASSLRGRLVRLGSVLDDIIIAHDYPEPVSFILAETVTLALLLASMLKYDGVFTLQSNSSGAVTMVVVDVTTSGHVRACAKYDSKKLSKLRKEPSFKDLMGDGYIAFTVDQGQHTDRYQGIVQLEGDSLQESIEHYFAQSEQIGTGIRMAVGKTGKQQAGWRAGAIMLQHLPDKGGHLDDNDRKTISYKEDSADMDEDWKRANILLETCTAEEFLSPSLDGNNLLVRLFHEEGVRVYEPVAVKKQCRCSKEKTENILRTLSDEELKESAENGRVSITCEFCNKKYVFDLRDLKA